MVYFLQTTHMIEADMETTPLGRDYTVHTWADLLQEQRMFTMK